MTQITENFMVTEPQELETHELKGYELIKKHYRNRKAKRTQVPLIMHIDDGLKIIDSERILIQEETNTTISTLKEAWCLHPLVQDTQELETNIRFLLKECKDNPEPLELALEYRELANSYLCREETDNYTDETLKRLIQFYSWDVKFLLLVDKIQNQADFLKFHLGKHPRTEELQEYFERWIRVLEEDLM